MKYHLAILTHGWTELILAGKKTIESRFTKVRCAPFGKVHEGDIVYLKESGGLVKGMFRVAKVETFENLTFKKICEIDGAYLPQIFGRDNIIFNPELGKWVDSKHATLIHIIDVVVFEEPYLLPFKKRDPRAWVVLDQPLHVCEICEDPFLLEVYKDPDDKLIHGNQHFCPPCYAREVAD